MASFYSEKELSKLGLKTYGKNVKISRNACLYGVDNISIGDNVRVDDFCILSGNVILGNYIHIAAGTYLFGGKSGIVLEDFVGISSRSAIYADSDDYTGIALTNPMVPDEFRNVTGGKVILKKHVLVGTGCTILPGVAVGEGSSIGSMSLITKDLDEWSMYVGIPCKRIKERKKDVLKLEVQLREGYTNKIMIND